MTTTIITARRLIQDLLLQFPDTPLRAADMEPALSGVLALIHDNPSERGQFARVFIEMLHGEQDSPEWLIAYCMRALRWPEVQRVAEAVRVAGEPRLLSLAWEVLDAYEDGDDWVGVHLFARYAASSSSPG